MNRNFDNENRQRRSAYADFDEFGNPLTGNTNSLSRYTPQSSYGSFGRGYQRQSSSGDRQSQSRSSGARVSNATRAYGDMSHGTRYGEGGSYEGGGTSYGHSYYGTSGNRGPGMSRQEGYWPESKQYGIGDYDKYINRNYGYFGRSSGGGYTDWDSDRPDQRRGDFRSDRYYNEPYEGRYRENSGYDRGYSGFGNTGYGSSRYNMRDQDRERSAYGNRDSRGERGRFNDEDAGYYRNRNNDTDW